MTADTSGVAEGYRKRVEHDLLALRRYSQGFLEPNLAVQVIREGMEQLWPTGAPDDDWTAEHDELLRLKARVRVYLDTLDQHPLSVTDPALSVEVRALAEMVGYPTAPNKVE